MQVFSHYGVMHSLHGAIIPISISFFKAHLSTTVKLIYTVQPGWIKTFEFTLLFQFLVYNHSTSNYVIFEFFLVEHLKWAVVFRDSMVKALKKHMRWKIGAGVDEHGVKKKKKKCLSHSRQWPWVGMPHLFSHLIYNGISVLSGPHNHTEQW